MLAYFLAAPAIYAAEGLNSLLATYLPAGKRVSLTPAVLASLEEALCQWVRRRKNGSAKNGLSGPPPNPSRPSRTQY
jgi:hypothetical protein